MSDIFSGLAKAKERADAKALERKAFAAYLKEMRAAGWSDLDVAEYSDCVRILMGDDDEATIRLFPDGVFSSAKEAREDAPEFWRRQVSA